MNKREIGRIGEEIAAEFLTEKGYQIIKRNFRASFGEIDLIATDGDYIVFIEVKRSRNSFHPGENLTYHKQQQIIKVAKYYINQLNLTTAYRFDVVLVRRNKQVTLIKNAFLT